MNPDQLPIVAVVGRPNVGKSTLVNRIIGSRQAVVDHQPGVTRDRREFVTDWSGQSFMLVDTGGWELDTTQPLTEKIRGQAEAAIEVAQLVLLVLDQTTSVTEEDAAVARLLQQSGVSVQVVVNKADNAKLETVPPEIWKLGLGEPVLVSGLHGRGVGELLDLVVALLPETGEVPSSDRIPRLAIVGRPNVGKSTLLNRLLGTERVIVSDQPGTTRDPIDVRGTLEGREVCWVDTAGVRRKPRIREEADFYAVKRAEQVVQSADMVLLVVDATEGIAQQDQRIAEMIREKGAGLVVLANKWDRVDEEARLWFETDLGNRLQFVGWAPVLRLSALTGSRVQRIAEAVELVLKERARRIPTSKLNRQVRQWVAAHPPPVRKGRRPQVKFVVQAGAEPPTLVWFVTGGELGEEYLRFLEGRLRKEYGFLGTPIRMVIRRRRSGRTEEGN